MDEVGRMVKHFARGPTKVMIADNASGKSHRHVVISGMSAPWDRILQREQDTLTIPTPFRSKRFQCLESLSLNARE